METDKILLERISFHQMLYASLSTDLGVFNGKMGVAIFFFHYARYTGNLLYEDFAEEFLDEILDNLYNSMAIDFCEGLSGIGWGIIYLMKQGFVETNIEETFESIDDKIMEYNIMKIKDRTLETGALGIVAYALSRLSISSHQKGILPFDEDFRASLYAFNLNSFSDKEIWDRILSSNTKVDGALSWKIGLTILLKRKI